MAEQGSVSNSADLETIQLSPRKEDVEKGEQPPGCCSSFKSHCADSAVVRSAPHGMTVLLALGGIVFASIALAQQRYYDATLAAIVVLLCHVIYTLQTQKDLVSDPDLKQQSPVLKKLSDCLTVLCGPTRSFPHVMSTLLGILAVVYVSIALVQQRFYEATLGSILVLICRVVYTLQTEHRTFLDTYHFKPCSDKSGYGSRMAPQVEASRRFDESRPWTERSMPVDELDLTGFAGALGLAEATIGVADAGSGGSNGTLTLLKEKAFAKEYLRCVRDLKDYKQTYGPITSARDVKADEVGNQGFTGLPRLNLEAVDRTPSGMTPRSPQGMASPDNTPLRQPSKSGSGSATKLQQLQLHAQQQQEEQQQTPRTVANQMKTTIGSEVQPTAARQSDLQVTFSDEGRMSEPTVDVGGSAAPALSPFRPAGFRNEAERAADKSGSSGFGLFG